jgi:hypothetical protein
MNTREIANLVQRANNVQWNSRAAMLVECDIEGDLKIMTYGAPMNVCFMKRKLRELLNNE